MNEPGELAHGLGWSRVAGCLRATSLRCSTSFPMSCAHLPPRTCALEEACRQVVGNSALSQAGGLE